MNIGVVHGIYTIVFMSAFIALGVWVYMPRNKKQFDDAASLPFNDADKTPDADKTGRPE